MDASILFLALTAAASTSSVAVSVGPVSKPITDRFVGTDVTMTTGASLQTFAPNQQLTHNPTVQSSVVLSPRFSLGAGFEANARLGFSYEWTNSDFTQTQNEPLLLDTTLGVSYFAPKLPWGTIAIAGASLTLPSSKISQARSMLVAPSVSLTALHNFQLGPVGLLLIGFGAYQHPFYRFTTPGVDAEPAYQRQCFGGEATCVDQASGLANASDILSWTVLAIARWKIIQGGITFGMSHQFPFGFDDLPGVDRVADTSTVRVTSTADLWAMFRVYEGTDIRVGYRMQRAVIEGDGTFGNLFYDRYQDGQLYVSLRLLPFQMFAADGQSTQLF